MSLIRHVEHLRRRSAFTQYAVWLTLLLLSGIARTETIPTQTNSFRGAELFDHETVYRIQIELSPANVQALRASSRRYVRATVRQDGKIYQEVGIHLKGSTGSFRSIDDKPGLTLDFGRFVSGQKFHGLRKIHLNNSVEDPAYLNEEIGGDLFRDAGVPAPRVTHALVELNNRPLGLYVLIEGFTEDFLGMYFKRTDGTLFDQNPSGNDGQNQQQQLENKSDAAPGEMDALMAATREPDLGRRWNRLENELDVDRFVTLMALEVMICHRDGYCLAQNNFRVYHDPGSNKMVYFPHGMDQLFGKSDLPWKPHMAGPVARSLMETLEGRRRYEARFSELFTNLFVIEQLTNRVNQIVAGLKPFLGRSEFAGIEREAAEVRSRIERRGIDLKRQLSQPEPALVKFQSGIARLGGWVATDNPATGKMSELTDTSGKPVLTILAGSPISASWRTSVRLSKGRYRFEGAVKIVDVKPLAFGKNQGAALRVAGKARPRINFTGDSSWKELGVEFQVDDFEESVELVCELRASLGEAWFDKDSLRLVEIH